MNNYNSNNNNNNMNTETTEFPTSSPITTSSSSSLNNTTTTNNTNNNKNNIMNNLTNGNNKNFSSSSSDNIAEEEEEEGSYEDEDDSTFNHHHHHHHNNQHNQHNHHHDQHNQQAQYSSSSNSNSSIVSNDSCLAEHSNNNNNSINDPSTETMQHRVLINEEDNHHHHSNSSKEEEKIASNNELFFFVMTQEEKIQFMHKVDRYVRERRPHEALSLLANKSKNLQNHLEDLMNQQETLCQKQRQSKLQYQFFDPSTVESHFYHDQERLHQLSVTIGAVRGQLVEIILKKVEMLLPMQLEQEAERDLKLIFDIDPQNELGNKYAAILEKQVQEKMYREEQEKLAKLQQECSEIHSEGYGAEKSVSLDRKRTNTLYDFSEECEELECPLCYRVFYEPVTLSCGHTFDRSCICRVHDYSDKCPLCRQTIHVVPYDYPITVVINELCQKYCKQQYEERKKEMEEENGTRQLNVNHIPIFVLDFVLYPHTVLPLHIFEPRYRLMMRRCMSGSKCFGLVCCGPNRNGDIAKYGCISKITSFKMLPDGRSIIETIGTERFKILEKWDTDGYICAKVQLLKDKTETEISVIENSQYRRDNISNVVSSSGSTGNNRIPGQNNSSLAASMSSNTSYSSLAEFQTNVWHQAERMTLQQLNEQLYVMVDTFLMEVGNETKQAILQKVGPFPKENEPEKLSFWVSAMLPLTTQLKLDLLSITNTKERLRVLLSICKQIAQSQQSNCSMQ